MIIKVRINYLVIHKTKNPGPEDPLWVASSRGFIPVILDSEENTEARSQKNPDLAHAAHAFALRVPLGNYIFSDRAQGEYFTLNSGS